MYKCISKNIIHIASMNSIFLLYYKKWMGFNKMEWKCNNVFWAIMYAHMLVKSSRVILRIFCIRKFWIYGVLINSIIVLYKCSKYNLTLRTTLTLKSRPLRFAIPRNVPGIISRIRFRLKSKYSNEDNAWRSASFMDYVKEKKMDYNFVALAKIHKICICNEYI